MPWGAPLVVPSRSGGRVACPLVSGTAGQRPLACLHCDHDHGGGEITPCKARRDAHTPPHGSTCTDMVPYDEERRHAAGNHEDNEIKKHEGPAM